MASQNPLATKAELTAGQKLEAVLADIDDPRLQDELRNAFFAADALTFARLLNARTLLNQSRGALLKLKVEQPVPYEFDLKAVLAQAAARLGLKLVPIGEAEAQEPGF